MGKIFYIVGKSCSGKDTIYRRLLEDGEQGLKAVVPYTTRPMRDGEAEGRDYFFRTEKELEELRAAGCVIEERVYQTYYGPWYYFTVDDGQIRPEEGSVLMIGTLPAYMAVRDYFGRDKVIPLYIDLDDGERLQRALNRERTQESPKYEEMCRRFLADSEDFSEEKVREAGIGRRFYNFNLEQCLKQLRSWIQEEDTDGLPM